MTNNISNRMDDLRDRYTNRRNLIFKANCPSKSPQARAQMRFLEHVWHNVSLEAIKERNHLGYKIYNWRYCWNHG